jgi:hypothetical protein
MGDSVDAPCIARHRSAPLMPGIITSVTITRTPWRLSHPGECGIVVTLRAPGVQ